MRLAKLTLSGEEPKQYYLNPALVIAVRRMRNYKNMEYTTIWFNGEGDGNGVTVTESLTDAVAEINAAMKGEE